MLVDIHFAKYHIWKREELTKYTLVDLWHLAYKKVKKFHQCIQSTKIQPGDRNNNKLQSKPSKWRKFHFDLTKESLLKIV